MLGVIPESQDVLSASNKGVPVIMNEKSDAALAYDDSVGRFLGDEVPFRFIDAKRRGFFGKLFGGK